MEHLKYRYIIYIRMILCIMYMNICIFIPFKKSNDLHVAWGMGTGTGDDP